MPVAVYPIDTMNGLARPDHHTLGIGTKGDPCFTLSKAHHHAVVIILGEEQSVTDVGIQQSTFWSEEHPVSRSLSPDFEKAWQIRVATSRSRILPLLTSTGPSGWSGRTCPAYCPAQEDGTLAPSSGAWANSGMGGPTESLTLSTSEWPSDGAACSLSQVLEDGNVPRRFYLSGTACRGILRRAEKRGKQLPRPLQAALTAVAQTGQAETSTALNP